MKRNIIAYLILISLLPGCKKFVEIDPPSTELSGASVFASEVQVELARQGLYTSLLGGYASGDVTGIGFLASLSSDDAIPGSLSFVDFYYNDLKAKDNAILIIWKSLYDVIYKSNSMIEGLRSSTRLPETTKIQLTAEAKFIRAYSYFYLINLFGDVPFTQTTDYRLNNNLPRSSKDSIYKSIISDLKDAAAFLPEQYAAEGKSRVTKWAATAMLARVYLYTQQWVNAETEASSIIENVARFRLVPLNNVFLTDSEEAIFQLKRTNGNPLEAGVYSEITNAWLRPDLINSFDKSDLRKTQWTIAKPVNGSTLYYPYKYKLTVPEPVKESTTLLRLAEQYLIRAEAKAQQNQINAALFDINALRKRAGASTVSATTQKDLLRIIEKERWCELFSEWGHRWFDLKRTPSLLIVGTSRAEDLLPPKGNKWSSNALLYPIPQYQIDLDPALQGHQNPGY
jgi:starch-binding outer membrane protein, SusD/RagB family